MPQTVTVHQINPYIRRTMQSVLACGLEIKRRIIFDYELIYVESGEFLFMYDETEYLCKEGMFLLLRPGIAHSFYSIRKDVSQPHIHFDMVHTANSHLVPISFKDLPECTQEERQLIREDIFKEEPRQPFVHFAQPQEALTLFYDIVAEGHSLSELQKKAKMLELLDLLIKDNYPSYFVGSPENSISVVQQIKEYIDAGQGMSACLLDLEKQFAYSKYYLDRQFKQEYGVSLIAYRNQKRMQRAQELLREMRVSDVAEELGFSSIYAFSRAYKNYFGYSPSFFRI